MDFLIFCITLHKGRLIPPKRGAARSNRAGDAKPEQAPWRLLRFVLRDSIQRPLTGALRGAHPIGRRNAQPSARRPVSIGVASLRDVRAAGSARRPFLPPGRSAARVPLRHDRIVRRFLAGRKGERRDQSEQKRHMLFHMRASSVTL